MFAATIGYQDWEAAFEDCDIGDARVCHVCVHPCVGCGVRIHPKNVCMSGRHKVQQWYNA